MLNFHSLKLEAVLHSYTLFSFVVIMCSDTYLHIQILRQIILLSKKCTVHKYYSTSFSFGFEN